MENVRIVCAPSGRWALLCREDSKSPWVQIESCATEAAAFDLVKMNGLDDDTMRRWEIDAAEGESADWGDDASATGC